MFLWVKALHIIAMVAFFAGLFYIFRLYVYHIETTSEEVKKQLEIMEERLLRIIINPALIATLLFGIWLVTLRWPLIMREGWFHAKLLLVLLLFGYHGMAAATRKKLKAGTCKLTSKQARMINELPTVLLILIVILAVVKPF